MLKKLMMVVAVSLLLVTAWMLQQRRDGLAARVEALEKRAEAMKDGPPTGASTLTDPRVARLEERVRTLEEILEKKIVRQGVDTDPKKIRDMPGGFDNTGLR